MNEKDEYRKFVKEEKVHWIVLITFALSLIPLSYITQATANIWIDIVFLVVAMIAIWQGIYLWRKTPVKKKAEQTKPNSNK